tara:strand:- start:760 stop:1077 length:318 start_codon:yes stop_codon:yes gene_type:complete
MNYDSLVNIKENIEKMDQSNQKEILKILKENEVNISENNNGSFINLSLLDKEMLLKLENYIEYFNKQQSNLEFIEAEKVNIKKEFFLKNKNKQLQNDKEEVVNNI